jgi:uncharacterized hydrophobic protein (TIGR00271 family)
VTEAKADKIHKSMISSIRKAFIYRFNLKDDQAEPAEVDSRIRDAVVFKGTNLWVLMLAIFIASIGLNVNSTAVIIGAMLISPLMGPIMGIGYGAGINDFELIKRGLKNLGIAILIGLLASTLYFMVTPLSEAQSELLSRTTPTIWDVLIALFGGMAGIVAATRKNKTNVIPGVAMHGWLWHSHRLGTLFFGRFLFVLHQLRVYRFFHHFADCLSQIAAQEFCQ